MPRNYKRRESEAQPELCLDYAVSNRQGESAASSFSSFPSALPIIKLLITLASVTKFLFEVSFILLSIYAVYVGLFDSSWQQMLIYSLVLIPYLVMRWIVTNKDDLVRDNSNKVKLKSLIR